MSVCTCGDGRTRGESKLHPTQLVIKNSRINYLVMKQDIFLEGRVPIRKEFSEESLQQKVDSVRVNLVRGAQSEMQIS